MGVCVVMLELIVLLSLSINANWPTCNDPDNEMEECPLGTSCVHLTQRDGPLRRPICIDCKFTTPLPEGVDAPWDNVVVGSPGSNATEYCLDSLYDLGNLRFLQEGNEYFVRSDTTFSFDGCMFKGAAYASMSALDSLILYAAFFLLTIEVGGDVRAQNRTSYVRQVALPWPSPERTLRCALTYLAFALVYVVDISLLLAVPTLIPCAMFMLIGADASSTSIILNGLSVGFILQLDQQLPFAFLSARELDAIDDYLTLLLKGREYTRTRWTDLNFKMQVARLYASPARVLATLSSFTYGYVVFKDDLIKIPCEQLTTSPSTGWASS